MNDILESAKYVFDSEIAALEKTKNSLGDDFIKALDLIKNCDGRLIITGMGKPGHVAKKLAATFSSLGTPSFHLHPAEALHGDLGMVTSKDVVMAISYSGESDEIVRILPSIKMIGASIIAVSGQKDSTLVKYSDISIIFPPFDEACHLKLAPTSSTTATMALGDALAIVASQEYGFQKSDFAKFHPAGALGKKLRFRVEDLMVKEDKLPVIPDTATLYEAIIELGKKELGMVVILNSDNQVAGIITDGDLRRMMQNRVNIYEVKVNDVMKRNPISISARELAINALHRLKEFGINGIVVKGEDNHLLGIIRLQNILEEGII